MGREIKRVALDFDWPQGVVWKGYVNPYSSQDCTACDSSGYNPETNQISEDWYDFSGTGRRWCNNITQDEVDALVEHNRLYEFVREWIPGQGWVEKDPPYHPTADEVNAWSRNGMGHDAINRWVCVEARAKRLGVWGVCPACDGHGEIWHSDKVRELADGWYDNERYDPPAGDGWQLWEDVTEGSPISPVFATVGEFKEYLIGEGYSEVAVDKFIEMGFSFSMSMKDGVIKSNIETLA